VCLSVCNILSADPGGHWLSVCLSVCMYVFLSVCLSITCLCVCLSVAFSQLTLEDVDSVSELGDTGPRHDVQPRLPMTYSSWLNQFNTNPYGASNLGHIPQSSYQPSDAVYAPPPPYNVVTAAGAKIVVPGGCGSFAAVCRTVKDPLTSRSHSGLSHSYTFIHFFNPLTPTVAISVHL